MIKHRGVFVGVMGMLTVVFAGNAWQAPFNHFATSDPVAVKMLTPANVQENVGNTIIDQSDEPNTLLTDVPGTITASGIIVKTPPASIF
jgi:hypothetical protein